MPNNSVRIMSVSKRSESLVQSEIRNMSIECDKIGGYNLSQGICDLPLNSYVKEGAKSAIDTGINYYTRYDGLEELRSAIAVKAGAYNNIQCDPEKNIIVSGGATGAFYSACLALLNPGDEVIIFEPYYGYHINTLNAASAIPVYVKLYPPDWHYNLSEIESVITEKTRGIMICTPSNPCGKVFNLQELKDLAQLAIRHNLWVFTDEIYEYFVYDGVKHISPGSLPEIADRTITISGYSKTFSITGWRIGYCISDEKWAKTIGYVSDLVYVCGPAPLQIGVANGIKNLGKDFYSNIQEKYKKLRDKICASLLKAKLSPYIPSGAYYILANTENVPGKTSKERAMNLLNKTGVASVPGCAFFHDDAGEDLVRFCFAKDEKIIDTVCTKLETIKF